MRLTDEQVMQDNKRFANCNALAELKYCGWDIPHRKSITNDEIHFYAWLCRSAVALLKEQEAVKPKEADNPEESEYCCGICGYPLWLDELYCAHCGRRIEWEGR